MNVTTIIVESLDWNGQLKTLTFSPREGADLWVARLDEYDSERSGPLHILDKRMEREFSRQFRRQAARPTTRFVALSGKCEFRTEWRGVPTERSGLSIYAICLPVDAVPDDIVLSDPHAPDRTYRYRALLDPKANRVVVYLECRSKFGSFDFDVLLRFHRDALACRAFGPSGGGEYLPDVHDLARMAGHRESDRIVVQKFFAGSTQIQAGDRSTIVSDSYVSGSVVGNVQGSVGAIGTAATGRVGLSAEDVITIIREQQGQLADELTRLQHASIDDPELNHVVAQARLALEAGDSDGTRSALRRAGRKGLSLATDLGVNLVAAVIAAQLGIG